MDLSWALKLLWSGSIVANAPALQAEDREFKSHPDHQKICLRSSIGLEHGICNPKTTDRNRAEAPKIV